MMGRARDRRVNKYGDTIDVAWHLYRVNAKKLTGWFDDELWARCWTHALNIVQGRTR